MTFTGAALELTVTSFTADRAINYFSYLKSPVMIGRSALTTG